MTEGYDLDDLSAAYRHRPITPSGIARATMSAEQRSGLAVDVGGGTGAHAEVFGSLGLQPLVVDLSDRMCRQAAARGVSAVQATSEQLPIRSATAGLVYFHLAIHYGAWRNVLDEALRIARRGAAIEIWTFDGEGIRESSLARWFPTVREIDSARFPDPTLLAAHLEASGASAAIEYHPDRVERKVGDWVSAVRARFVSTIQMLEDDEVEQGLDEFSRRYPDPNGVYAYTLHYRRITAIV